MATIREHLAGELLLEQSQRTAMHGLSLGSIKLQAAEGESREVFEPVVAAMAVLRVSLQPEQLLPKRLQAKWRGEHRAATKQPNPIARSQGKSVTVPAVTTARGIGSNPMIKQWLKPSSLIGPLATD